MNTLHIVPDDSCGKWCLFNLPNDNGNTWCQVYKKPSPDNKDNEQSPSTGYKCASGIFCMMKRTPQGGFYKYKACKQPMHDALCTAKDNEDGNMWCLLCCKKRKVSMVLLPNWLNRLGYQSKNGNRLWYQSMTDISNQLQSRLALLDGAKVSKLGYLVLQKVSMTALLSVTLNAPLMLCPCWQTQREKQRIKGQDQSSPMSSDFI